MGIIEDIKSLATQIGTDVKALRNEKANKNDFDRVVTALNNIADGLKGNTTNSQAGVNTNATINGSAVSESFAQRVVKELIKNHFPYLKSEEDSFSEFVKFMETKTNNIQKINSYKVSFNGDTLTVELTPINYNSVNVKYVINGENHEEIISSKKSFINVDSIKYRECDYYGVYGDEIEKTIYLDSFRKQMKHPENYVFKYDVDSSYIQFNKITDNTDYSFLNFTDNNFYLSLAKQKANEIDSSKTLQENIQYSIKSFELNGTVKVAIIEYNKHADFGLSSLNDATLKSNPKYLAIIGDTNIYTSSIGILNKYIDLESIYNSLDSSDTWNERASKIIKSKTAIYRWDATQNKYMFESTDTLDDWLKTHPLDTL